MRRWLLRILRWLTIAIIVLIVIVQCVLWSPWPKQIVLGAIEQQLGLRISADTLSTGWFGRSELSNVSIGLPLSANDFLKVKTLKLKHTYLIGLALGSFTIDSIEIDNPQVDVIQNPQGQWNLQQVIQLLGRLGGASAATSDQSIPKLPAINLVNGSIDITDNQKHTVALQPLNATGSPDGSLVWNYKLSIAESIAMTGKVAPGGSWQHTVTLDAHNLDPLLKNWGVKSTYAANIKSHLDGQIAGGKWMGTLTFDQASVTQSPVLGDVKIDGAISAVVDGSTVTLTPNALNLKTTNITLPNLGIEAGSIISDGKGLRTESLKLRALGGLANVDASFDPRTSDAKLIANWSGLSLATNTTQSGSITASLHEPFAGQPVIAVDATDIGTIGASGRWNTKLNLTGQGSSWQAINWVLTAPQMVYTTGSQTIDLSQMTAHVSQHLPRIELTSLSLPANNLASGTTPANLSSSGWIDFDKSLWKLDLAGGFNTTFQNVPLPLKVALHADGSDALYNLKNLVVDIAGVTLTADGSYEKSKPNPVDLHVALTQAPRASLDTPVQGEVAGDFKIVGALFKEEGRFRPYLTTTGDLRSSDLVLFDRPVGDIDINLQGETKTPNLQGGEPGPVITEVHTSDFNLFQAPWNLSIDYTTNSSLHATLQTHRLELEELARFAKLKGITGEIAAKWDVVLPSINLNDLSLHSQYQLTDVRAFGFTIDTVAAAASINGGVLKLDSLNAKYGTGTLATTASLDLQNPRHLVTDTTLTNWPVAISDSVSATVSAHTGLDFDLKAVPLGANGQLTASTDILLGNTRLAHAELDSTILNRAVSVDTLAGNILNNKFTGQGKFDLDKPLQATGQLLCDNLEGDAIATIVPALQGLTGRYSAAVTVGPAHDPRPLEPVRMDINLASTNGHYRSVQIGGGGLLTLHAVAYLNTDRLVLDHSDIYLAGGVAHVWGRINTRPATGLATQVTVEVSNLQLNQFAHLDPKLTQSIPGLISGRVNAIRAGMHSSQVLVQSHIDLSQTDLGNFGPIAALYGLMHVGSSTSTGHGDVDLAFEQDVIRVTNFSYFNQGIEARGLCTIGPFNYDNVLAAKIDGQVVGTARALKDTRLPLLADFDNVFSAFQGGLTTVNVSGSIEKPKYQAGLVSDIGKGMRQLLVGEAESNKK